MTVHEEEEPIAIIGSACRFSGDVSSMGDLWDMMNNSRTGHCKIPADRWNADLLHHPDPDRKGTVRSMFFFYNRALLISPRWQSSMDIL